MDDKEFKGYVVEALKQLIERQDNLDTSIHQLREETSVGLQQLRTETKTDIQQLRTEMKANNKRMDKKIDKILEYVEHVDREFQSHRMAERI